MRFVDETDSNLSVSYGSVNALSTVGLLTK